MFDSFSSKNDQHIQNIGYKSLLTNKTQFTISGSWPVSFSVSKNPVSDGFSKWKFQLVMSSVSEVSVSNIPVSKMPVSN